MRKRINDDRLLALGFVPDDDGIFMKDGIEIWDSNGDYWIIDMLDQNGINRPFKYLDELEYFFNACGLKLTGQ